jgi:glycosyltransferase involved in cell wall biosynthesis
MIWDSPEYLAANLHYSMTAKKNLSDAVDKLAKRAYKVAVISEGMQRHYRSFTAIEPIIVRHGISAQSQINKNKKCEEPLKIVFAGSLYAKKEWNAFIEALNAIQWEFSGRKIEMHFIGDFPLHGATSSPKVIHHGRLPFSDTMNLLQQMDVGYLPYWFSQIYSHVVRTSFPGKMSAYAAAGLAVFHHAPDYSSGVCFLDQYKFGVSCTRLEHDAILNSLRDLNSLLNNNDYKYEVGRAFSEELSNDAMSTRFRSFLSQ